MWGSALAAGLVLLACPCEAFAPANMPARVLLTGVSAVQMKGVPPRPLNPSAPKGSAAARLRLLLGEFAALPAGAPVQRGTNPTRAQTSPESSPCRVASMRCQLG